MRLLLDTHTFLWFIAGDVKLSRKAQGVIEDAANEKFVSIASLWEIAIKLSLGKLSLGGSFEVLIPQQLERNGFELLSIKVEHMAAVATLVLHHRDPFDRLLIAQAIVEGMQVVSIDNAFDAYPIARLW